jgi:hydroxymethylbilane synthase
LRLVRPDLAIEPLRGNVDSRLRKVTEGPLDAIVLAAAGLRRLGLEGQITETLGTDDMLPAVGQGALGIEARADASATRDALERTRDLTTSLCVGAERAVMLAVEGNCRMPVAAHARRRGEALHLSALLAEVDGSRLRRTERVMAWPASIDGAALAEAERLGRDAGEELRRA